MRPEISKGLSDRIEVIEKKLDLAISAIHLLTTSAQPTSKWLDASLAALLSQPREKP